MEMRSLGQTGLMEILLRDGKQTQIFPLPNPPIFNPKLHTGSLYFLSANLIHDDRTVAENGAPNQTCFRDQRRPSLYKYCTPFVDLLG